MRLRRLSVDSSKVVDGPDLNDGMPPKQYGFTSLGERSTEPSISSMRCSVIPIFPSTSRRLDLRLYEPIIWNRSKPLPFTSSNDDGISSVLEAVQAGLVFQRKADFRRRQNRRSVVPADQTTPTNRALSFLSLGPYFLL